MVPMRSALTGYPREAAEPRRPRHRPSVNRRLPGRSSARCDARLWEGGPAFNTPIRANVVLSPKLAGSTGSIETLPSAQTTAEPASPS
jgi:hypothetical protein